MLERRASEIAIIGAGLTGCCLALELAGRGRRVLLLDRDDAPMNRASLRNEGKIHLGLIYAADPTFRTAALQLDGALSFTPSLRRWLGDRADAIGASSAFDYLVARDSILDADALSEHFARLEALAAERLAADPSLDYLGERVDWLARPASRRARYGDAKVGAVFETTERAVNTDDLAREVAAAVGAHPNIETLFGTRVETAARMSAGVRLDCAGPERRVLVEADQAANCAWEDRIRIDETIGVEAAPGWVYRLKYRLMARTPAALVGAASATIVIGPYGDVVLRDDGIAYLSWYPTGCRGWTHDIAAPADWGPACRGETDAETARSVASEALRNLAEWYPEIAAAKPLYVDAGAIVAYGNTDVDDPKSGLHDRTRIGVFGDGVWFSVDPGKLTTAPLFTLEAADRICS